MERWGWGKAKTRAFLEKSSSLKWGIICIYTIIFNTNINPYNVYNKEEVHSVYLLQQQNVEEKTCFFYIKRRYPQI